MSASLGQLRASLGGDKSILTFTEDRLVSLTLKHLQIVQKRQHILWWLLDGK